MDFFYVYHTGALQESSPRGGEAAACQVNLAATPRK